jgi:hypothetical protein
VNVQVTNEKQCDVLVAGVGDCGSSLLVILRKLCANLQGEGFEIEPWFVDYSGGQINHDEKIAQIVSAIKGKEKYRRFEYTAKPFKANELSDFLREHLFIFGTGQPALSARRRLDSSTLADVVGKRRLIAYLATPPEAYPAYIEELHDFWAERALPAVVALEKPLANSAADLRRLDHLVQRVRRDRFQVVSVDHYLGKRALELIQEAFRNFRAFQEDIQEKTLQVAVEFIETDLEDARQRPYFLKTGIIKDMMPHALAVVRSLFDDARLLFHVRRWRWGSQIEPDATNPLPTFFEGEFVTASAVTPPRSVWIRLMKGAKELRGQKLLKICTGDPAPISVDFATGEVAIGEGHTFKARWEGEAGWENCLLWLLRQDYARFPAWEAAVSGVQTILEIDQGMREKAQGQVTVPAISQGLIHSPLGLDWQTLRPRNRNYLFMHLNGWLLNTAAFNEKRVQLLCQQLGVEKPAGIDNTHSLSLHELAVRIISLCNLDAWLPRLSELETGVYNQLLEYTRTLDGGVACTVEGAKAFLEAVAERGRLRDAAETGLRIVVISNSRKDHVASFLHSSGLAPHVFLATNREYFRGRDAALKQDLAERLGITRERLVILHDQEYHFLNGAMNIRGERNNMHAALQTFHEQGII